jgi:hypothetical protein
MRQCDAKEAAQWIGEDTGAIPPNPTVRRKGTVPPEQKVGFHPLTYLEASHESLAGLDVAASTFEAFGGPDMRRKASCAGASPSPFIRGTTCSWPTADGRTKALYCSFRRASIPSRRSSTRTEWPRASSISSVEFRSGDPDGLVARRLIERRLACKSYGAADERVS